VDAVIRAKALFQLGLTTEEVVRDLRAEGFSAIMSMSALITVAGMSYSGAQAAVVDSPIWADQRHLVTTSTWIDPPDPPDEETLEHLRAACREEPRIVEAWVTGSRITRADGSSYESTGIALVLDPPLSQLRDEEEGRASGDLLAKLQPAAPHASSWLFVSEQIIAAHANHCRKVYTRVTTP
jgi:hypothetical protein